MMREWTDRMPGTAASDLWQKQIERDYVRRVDAIQADLDQAIASPEPPAGFYEAMRSFLVMRDRLFPDMPADPAWKILVTLAQTPPDSPKASITGIVNGAEVPLTTALRYIATMEARGIVERVPHPTDRRQMMIRLTEDGKKRLCAIAEQWQMRLLWLAVAPIGFLAAGAAFFG